ncbi:MAG: type II secretion system F family protein [Solobacterium sp.]|nr:type II secretion system F family protein [Solobacterium sp.]
MNTENIRKITAVWQNASVRRWLKEQCRRLRQKATCLDEEDCEAIVSLMNNGFSLQDTLAVIQEKRNEACIRRMRERMEEGESFAEIFRENCPRAVRVYFEGFSRYADFTDSLAIALHIVRQEKERREQLQKGLFYPCALLASVGIGVRLFSLFILPSLLSLMKEFSAETASYEMLMHAMNGMFALLVIMLSAGGIAVVYLQDPKRLCRFYEELDRRIPDSLLSCHVSEQFCRFYLECVRRGIPTRRSLDILKTMAAKPLVAYTAASMDALLMAGRGMESALAEAPAESRLKHFFRIAMYAEESTVMLEGYLNMVSIRTARRIALFSRAVRLVCYGLIAVMLVCVYGMLMMPVTMIQNI